MTATDEPGPIRSTCPTSLETWTIKKSVKAPQFACAIERLSHESTSDRNRILWTGPRGPGRVTLIGKLSYDEGETFPTERVIYEDNAGYSDLTYSKKMWPFAFGSEITAGSCP